jgi:hypothetical protein
MVMSIDTGTLHLGHIYIVKEEKFLMLRIQISSTFATKKSFSNLGRCKKKLFSRTLSKLSSLAAPQEWFLSVGRIQHFYKLGHHRGMHSSPNWATTREGYCCQNLPASALCVRVVFCQFCLLYCWFSKAYIYVNTLLKNENLEGIGCTLGIYEI